MKKYFIIILLVVVFFPSSSFAVSGTCSDHQGVNCNFGADIDGSAVCNDGWAHSTELFYSVLECKNTTHSCGSETYNKLLRKYDIEEQEQAIGDLTKKITQITSQGKGNYDRSEFYLLVDKVSLLQNKIDSDLETIKRDCNVIGEKEHLEYKKKLFEQVYAPKEVVQTPAENLCVSRGVANSHQEGNYCICDNGFYQSPKTNKCVLIEQFSADGLGEGGIAVGKDCGCENGYVVDSVLKKCVLVSSQNKKTNSAKLPNTNNLKIENIKVEQNIPVVSLDENQNSVTNQPTKKLKWYQKIFNWFWRR